MPLDGRIAAVSGRGDAGSTTGSTSSMNAMSFESTRAPLVGDTWLQSDRTTAAVSPSCTNRMYVSSMNTNFPPMRAPCQGIGSGGLLQTQAPVVPVGNSMQQQNVASKSSASSNALGYNTPLPSHSIRAVSLDSSASQSSRTTIPYLQHHHGHAEISPSPPSRNAAVVGSSSLVMQHVGASLTTIGSSVPAAPRNAEQQRLFCYTVLTLERPSISTSWGLSISYHHDRVMIGAVNSNVAPSPTSYVRGYWTTTSPIAPQNFLKSPHSGGYNDPSDGNRKLSHFVRHLLTQRHCLASSSASSSTRHWPITMPLCKVLAPGDCLIGAAGVAISTLCSLAAISDVLRHHASTTIQLVVHHNERARQAACAVTTTAPTTSLHGKSVNNSPDPAYAAACAAWNVMRGESSLFGYDGVARKLFVPPNSPYKSSSAPSYQLVHPLQQVAVAKNKLFTDPSTGETGIPFDDESHEYDPDDGCRAHLFMSQIDSIPDWLVKRKATWRQRYKVYPILDDRAHEPVAERRAEPTTVWQYYSETADRLDCNVAVDFWTSQGFDTHLQWLQARTRQWQTSYSWNVLKRKALENDCTEVVHLPGTIGDDKSDRDSFLLWLRVRKNQWQVQRRKRQRTIAASLTDRATDADGDNDKLSWSGQSKAVLGSSAQKAAASHTSELSVIIDALLENQERERKVRVARPPLDIAFLFDSELGVPDDIVANVFSFLHCTEHGKLLCIDRTTRRRLMTRDQVWQQLCPSHWKLPRRPRKPWHELYLSNLRIETERSRKQWDDALLRGCEMLQGRGQFQQLKHLVDRAQKTCQFDINYSSGVVCERNSLLNLAVIHGKLKIVQWLVEEKNADIESVDRGGFGPLLNAAWSGDKRMVRYLMSRGADRSRIGRYHYFCPVAEADFAGLTAEQWATKKGFLDVATLLRLGL